MATLEPDPIFHAALIARIILGLVFLAAGALKFSDSKAFDSLLQFIVPPLASQAPLIRIALSMIEISVGGMLLMGIWFRLALSGALVLLSAFLFVLILAIGYGYTGSCACFGQGNGRPIDRTHVLRGILLVLASAFDFVTLRTRPEIGSHLWLMGYTVLFGAAVAVIVLMLIFSVASQVDSVIGYRYRPGGNRWDTRVTR